MGRGLALFSQIVRFLGLFGVPLQVGFQGKITFNHMLGQPILQKLSDFNGDIGDIVFVSFRRFKLQPVKRFDQGLMFFLMLRTERKLGLFLQLFFAFEVRFRIFRKRRQNGY